ncbi:MAG: hypothetical protein WKF73_03365 [Nocardioidaceae bacterium]
MWFRIIRTFTPRLCAPISLSVVSGTSIAQVAIRIVDPLRLLEIALSMRSMIRCFSSGVPDGRLKIPLEAG